MRTVLLAAVGALIATTLTQTEAHAVPAGHACGGFVGAVCDAGLWCDPVPGSCYVPLAGVCRGVPQVCTRIYRPVCGCDGRTYGNDCDRQSRRVPKLYDGAC